LIRPTASTQRETLNTYIMSTVIQVSNLSKIYRLGEIGTGTISRDLERWYKMKIRGQEDPFLKIGETNVSSKKGVNDVVYALRDINFEVQQGEALGIIGKNGAGKSTLLKILSRVTSPTTGKINIKGRAASLLEVGTGFHPELTGRENIYLNGAILGMRKKEITRKLNEIIDFSGVERYIDTPVKRYSSGMYVRLAFAVAAHLESEILIVDEVLAVGDAEFQKKCIGKMGEVSKGEGRTILFVSHNMGSIRKLCQSGIFLTNGAIQSVGEIEAIVDLYIKGDNGISVRSITWENNPNKPICITGVNVVADNKTEEQLLDINDKIKVLIEYNVNETIINSNISFGLSKDGILLFRSWDIDSNPENFTIRKSGQHTAELTMPDFLQPGIYSIYAACGRPGIGAIDVRDDALTFEIENVSTDGSMQSFSRGGLIRTYLNWMIK
jgi:lipopolysaccharide transport system ATP-binding protein